MQESPNSVFPGGRVKKPGSRGARNPGAGAYFPCAAGTGDQGQRSMGISCEAVKVPDSLENRCRAIGTEDFRHVHRVFFVGKIQQYRRKGKTETPSFRKGNPPCGEIDERTSAAWRSASADPWLCVLPLRIVCLYRFSKSHMFQLNRVKETAVPVKKYFMEILLQMPKISSFSKSGGPVLPLFSLRAGARC